MILEKLEVKNRIEAITRSKEKAGLNKKDLGICQDPFVNLKFPFENLVATRIKLIHILAPTPAERLFG